MKRTVETGITWPPRTDKSILSHCNILQNWAGSIDRKITWFIYHTCASYDAFYHGDFRNIGNKRYSTSGFNWSCDHVLKPSSKENKKLEQFSFTAQFCFISCSKAGACHSLKKVAHLAKSMIFYGFTRNEAEDISIVKQISSSLVKKGIQFIFTFPLQIRDPFNILANAPTWVH